MLLVVLVLPPLILLFYQLPTSIDSIYHAFILIESVFGLFGVVISILYCIPLHRFKKYSDIELKLIDLVFLATVSASIVVQIVARAYDGAELLFRCSVLFAAVGLSVRVSKTLYEIAVLQHEVITGKSNRRAPFMIPRKK
ncbi:MAG: hypothetical protein R3C58_05245 [Parvularculaceae bacterium]